MAPNAESARGRIGLALQRTVLRSGGGRAGWIWRGLYRTVARALASALTLGAPASAYARSGLAGGELVPGLSDIDLAVIADGDPRRPGAGAEPVRRRWRLLARLPGVRWLVDEPRIYEDADLRDLAAASSFTYGLDGGGPAPRESGYFGAQASVDRVRALERPGLDSLAGGWSRLAGAERRPPHQPPGAAPLAGAWLELVFCWRLAFRACADPSGHRAADICAKVVADSAAVWLRLAHGERGVDRASALARAAELLPEERGSLARMAALRRALPLAPAAPLADAIGLLLRFSRRIHSIVAAEAARAGAVEVRLAGGGAPDPARRLPLCDWRALVCPPAAEEWLEPRPEAADDAAAIGELSRAGAAPHPFLRADGLMVLPGGGWPRTRLRTIQSAVTDPVSFALADGHAAASFPALPGWRAADVAERGVAEHRARMRSGQAGEAGELGVLLTAARAALFRQSLAEGEPRLTVTAAATAERLSRQVEGAGSMAQEALIQLRRPDPDPALVAALREAVISLPPYRGAGTGGAARAGS